MPDNPYPDKMAGMKYRDILFNAPVGFFRAGPDGMCLFINLAATRMLGYDTPEELTGDSADIVSQRPADPADRDALRHLLEKKGKAVDYELRLRRKDGTLFWASCNIAAVRDESGKVVGYEGFVTDIHDRKLAEEELRRNEQFLEAIFNSIQDGISVLDTDLNILATNKIMKSWYAHALPMEGKKCYQVYHGRTAPCEKCPTRRALQTGKLEMEEVPLTVPGGTAGTLELFAFPLLDQTGIPIGVVEYVRDVTTRKRAEQKLMESEEKYRSLVEQSVEMIYLHDLDGNILEVNEASVRNTGYSRDEYSRMTVFDLHPDQSRKDDIRRQWKAWRVGESITLEQAHIHKNGGEHPVEVTTGKVRFSGRDYILAQVRDMADRKKAREELQESEKRFSSAFRSSPAPQVISEIDTGKFIDVNDRWEEMLGYTREELVGRTSKEVGIWADPGERDRIVEKLLQRGSFKNEPIVFTTRTGQSVTALWSGEAIILSGRKVMLSMLYDETERKQAEKEREKLQDQLFQAQKLESVGRLAGGIAHDFNNMLSVIQGYAEMADLKVLPNDPVRQDLAEILRAARRSTEITRQLLAFARKQTINPRVIDLNHTVTDMLKIIRRLIGENIDLSWRPGPDIWPVRMDPTQIDQVVANLCVNARDAIGDVGKITMETENIRIDEAYCLDHAEFFPGEYAMLAVSDDGQGMEKETLGNIFEPFFTTKEVGRGTGLGLPTVYGIVKQNNGFINVYSEPGKGTTVRVYFARHEGRVDPVRKDDPETLQRGAGETILVVEDEASILKLAEAMLGELGYTVLTANTPGDAITLASAHPDRISLLITDVVMPEMSGRDLARQLENTYADIRILYMSGYTANVIAHQGVLEKGIHFIPKPFSIQELAAKVRAVLCEG